MELRRKTEIHEIEERKNQQINDLLRNHEKAFSDIKNYYNDITLRGPPPFPVFLKNEQAKIHETFRGDRSW
jgi:hypothetical protein